ncbi:type II toxin-antitoxin system RelE family toxin [Spirosoma fluviale]|uniref:mRNA interferase RelE/StbE n=1 Tax=Spirosoma fluviale TaxID=1597977 RepID=A0A286F5S7_9BACT|nr:type II toxin-antitoxin system RelE/ParE family toxin [Spirosoma fluviale]SOD78542.1 mRNA interferase RelE/StbE [Spirosoma fluviale]
MAEYTVILTKTAQKQLDKLPDQVVDTLLDAIEKLGEEPRPEGCKKLKGRSGYRIRKGNYRIIYDIQDDVLIVEVVAISHRRQIYE